MAVWTPTGASREPTRGGGAGKPVSNWVSTLLHQRVLEPFPAKILLGLHHSAPGWTAPTSLDRELEGLTLRGEAFRRVIQIGDDLDPTLKLGEQATAAEKDCAGAKAE